MTYCQRSRWLLTSNYWRVDLHPTIQRLLVVFFAMDLCTWGELFSKYRQCPSEFVLRRVLPSTTSHTNSWKKNKVWMDLTQEERKRTLTEFCIFILLSADLATAECVCLPSSQKLRFSVHYSRRFRSSFVKRGCGQRQILESVAERRDSTALYWRSFCVHGE